jgi:hypothetical protein
MFFNEGHCYGCISNGSIGMKHPDKADAYSGGHLDVHLPYSGRRSRPNTWTGSKEDVNAKSLIIVKIACHLNVILLCFYLLQVAAEEARLRYIYGM